MPDFWTQVNITQSHINVIGPDGHTWAQVPITYEWEGRAEKYAEKIVAALQYDPESIQQRLDDLQDTAFRLRGMLDNYPEDIDASAAHEAADAIVRELESLNQRLDGEQE